MKLSNLFLTLFSVSIISSISVAADMPSIEIKLSEASHYLINEIARTSNKVIRFQKNQLPQDSNETLCRSEKRIPLKDGYNVCDYKMLSQIWPTVSKNFEQDASCTLSSEVRRNKSYTTLCAMDLRSINAPHDTIVFRLVLEVEWSSYGEPVRILNAFDLAIYAGAS